MGAVAMFGQQQACARLARPAKACRCRWPCSSRCLRLCAWQQAHVVMCPVALAALDRLHSGAAIGVFQPRGIACSCCAGSPAFAARLPRASCAIEPNLSPVGMRQTLVEVNRFPRAVTAPPGMDCAWPRAPRSPGRPDAYRSAVECTQAFLVESGGDCAFGERLAAAGKFILHPLHPKPALAGSTHSSSSSCLVPPPFSSGEFP